MLKFLFLLATQYLETMTSRLEMPGLIRGLHQLSDKMVADVCNYKLYISNPMSHF